MRQRSARDVMYRNRPIWRMVFNASKERYNICRMMSFAISDSPYSLVAHLDLAHWQGGAI